MTQNADADYVAFSDEDIAELVAGTKAALPTLSLDDEDVVSLAAASAPLWRALGAHGLVDGYGGSEFIGAFPLALRSILALCNPLRDDFQGPIDSSDEES